MKNTFCERVEVANEGQSKEGILQTRRGGWGGEGTKKGDTVGSAVCWNQLILVSED